MTRRIVFESGAFDDFTAWATEDKKLYAKIVRLIKDVQRSPFTGLGKPEPLRHELKGYWSSNSEYDRMAEGKRVRQAPSNVMLELEGQ